jgi:hypothetical protein
MEREGKVTGASDAAGGAENLVEVEGAGEIVGADTDDISLGRSCRSSL